MPSPSKSTFDLPTFALTPQPTAIVEGCFGAPAAVWANQRHAAFEQPLAQGIAVAGLVGHDSQRPFLQMAAATTRYRYLSQDAFGQSLFRRADRNQSASQRKILSVDQPRPHLGFAPLGFGNSEAPVLAEVKLPSRKHLLQSNLPRWSNSERNARQLVSQTPHCSPARTFTSTYWNWDIPWAGHASGRQS